jgi:hypothetical protein
MNPTNLIEDLRRLSPPDHGGLLAAGLVVLALLALGYLARRRRLRPAATPPRGGTSAPSAWELALAELERLAPLLQPETSRAYGLAAAAVLRRYLEGRYAWPAPRLATEEFLAVVRSAPSLGPAQQETLGRFLAACDRFKFGRYTASMSELRELQAAVLALVLASRPSHDG